MRRFELLTPRSQSVCATKLRHIPVLQVRPEGTAPSSAAYKTAALTFVLRAISSPTQNRTVIIRVRAGYSVPLNYGGMAEGQGVEP